MRSTFLLWLLLLIACNNSEHIETTEKDDTTTATPETLQVEAESEALLPKMYSNERFKDVAVERIGQNTFLVRGQGQLYEANFNWVVEDGHEELKEGFHMTDVGAPEWGNFEFTMDVHKKRAESTLTLVLFELSPKDGSRQHELLISLY